MQDKALAENENGVAPHLVWIRFGKRLYFSDNVEPLKIAVVGKKQSKATTRFVIVDYEEGAALWAPSGRQKTVRG
jgi:hypothetical protein